MSLGWLVCSALAKLPFNLLLNFLFKKSETRDRENKFAKGSPKFTHPDSDNPALKQRVAGGFALRLILRLTIDNSSRLSTASQRCTLFCFVF